MIEPDEALDELMGAVREGVASDEQMNELGRRISEEPDVRRYFAEQCSLNAMLSGELARSPAPMQVPPVDAPVASAVRPTRYIFLGAAAAAVIAAGLWISFGDFQSGVEVAHAAPASDDSIASVVAGTTGKVLWTEDAVWQYESAYAVGGNLPAHTVLHLNKGRVLVELRPGIRILASGNTKFEMVSGDRLRLHDGNLGIQVVGDSSIRCDVPGAIIRDVGTEFSLQVKNERTLAHVFDGQISAALLRRSEAPILINAGQALHVDPHAGNVLPSEIEANATLRISELSVRSITAGFDYADTVRADGATRFWRFSDVVSPETHTDAIRQPFKLRPKSWVKALPTRNNVLAMRNPQGIAAAMHEASFSELDGDAFSIELWFRQLAGDRTRSTIMGITTAADPQTHHALVQVLRTKPKTACRIRVLYRQSPQDLGLELVTPAALTTDVWHHLVIRRGDQSLAVFVDGSKRIEQALTDTGIAASTSLRKLLIGHMNDQGETYQYYFDGEIDEIAFYPGALEDEMIADHFRKGRSLFDDVDPAGERDH